MSIENLKTEMETEIASYQELVDNTETPTDGDNNPVILSVLKGFLERIEYHMEH